MLPVSKVLFLKPESKAHLPPAPRASGFAKAGLGLSVSLPPCPRSLHERHLLCLWAP